MKNIGKEALIAREHYKIVILENLDHLETLETLENLDHLDNLKKRKTMEQHQTLPAKKIESVLR